MASSRKRVRWDDKELADASDTDHPKPTKRLEKTTKHTSFAPLNQSLSEYTTFEMVRVLPTQCTSGPASLSSWLVHAILAVPHPNPEAPQPSESWSNGTHVLDLLRFAIEARDPRMVGTVWGVLYRRAKGWEAASALILNTPSFVESLLESSCSKFVNVVAFLALVSRRPRLLLAVLQSFVATGCGVCITSAAVNSLTCIVLAIQACIFGPDHGVSYEKGFETFAKRHHNLKFATDSALYLGAWNQVTEALLKLCGGDVAKDVVLDVRADGAGERKKTIQSVLSVAVRCAELNTRFLEQLLAVKDDWSAAALDAALKVAISPTGVRGPNLTGVIAKLYGALLHEWKSNSSKRKRGIIGEYDELTYVWRNLVASCTGYDSVETGKDGNMPMPISPFLTRLEKVDTEGTVKVSADSSLRRHPEEWKGIFDLMIECHAPKVDEKDEKLEGCESREWDTSSPLFESLIRHVICKLINCAEKTELLVYFIGVLDKGRGEGRPPPTWLQIHGLVNMLALNHPLVLGIAIQHMKCDDEGNKHPHPLTRHHEALQSGLLLCLLNMQRQSAKLLVKALIGNLCTLDYIKDETHGLGTDVKIGFLPYYVMQMGEGATAETRRKHGEDYGLFINSRVEADFKEVLSAMDWPQAVLQEALKFASHYQRPICATQLLSACHDLSPGDDPYLLSINSWLHEPGHRGAEQAASEFKSLVTKK